MAIFFDIQKLFTAFFAVFKRSFWYQITVTVYAEIGHLSAKFILRYKPKQLKRKVLANFFFFAYIV